MDGIASVDDENEDDEADPLSFKKDDVAKMHAYRDALPHVCSARLVYPRFHPRAWRTPNRRRRRDTAGAGNASWYPVQGPRARARVRAPWPGPVNLGGREYVVEAGDHLTRVEVLEAKFAADQAKRADKRTEEAGRKVAAKGRSQYAANVEENFLKKGQNVKVRVTGTVLRIAWVLCDRATLYQLVDGEESTRPMLQGLGFTRVVCHDGYNEGAYTNL